MDTHTPPPPQKTIVVVAERLEAIDATAFILRADAFSLLTKALPYRPKLLNKHEQGLKDLFQTFADYDLDLFQILPHLDPSSVPSNDTPDVFLAKRQVILDLLQFTANTLNNHRVRERTNLLTTYAYLTVVFAATAFSAQFLRPFLAQFFPSLL